MITVQLHGSRGLLDEAIAEDPESAIFASRTLWDESCDANPYRGWSAALRVTFVVDGKAVRTLAVRP